jgi:type II secretory pathway pseudopilin PulG
MRGERGFTVVDMLVATAILAGLVLVTAFNFSRPPKLHPAALALQAALSEGRSLATTFGQISDVRGSVGFSGLDGATVTITPDPLDADRSVISVWRSRPRSNGDPLTLDPGFPPQHVPVRFTSSTAGPEPFSVLISSAGYASIQGGFPSELPPPNTLETDPGCREEGESIAVVDGSQTETHRIECREGIYDASVSGS